MVDNEKKSKEDVVVSNESFLTARFASPGSAIFEINMNNVIPLQLIALANYLQLMGETFLLQQESERARRETAQKIIVPEGKFVRKQ